MKLLQSALLLLSLVLSFSTFAREGVAIVNHDNVLVTTASGKAAQAEQVKQAIMVAAATKAWNVSSTEDGKLMASINVRGKHTVMVDIAYSGAAYSLSYKDSVNMNYVSKNGVPSIHPSYNKWVQTLLDGIRFELLKL